MSLTAKYNYLKKKEKNYPKNMVKFAEEVINSSTNDNRSSVKLIVEKTSQIDLVIRRLYVIN